MSFQKYKLQLPEQFAQVKKQDRSQVSAKTGSKGKYYAAFTVRSRKKGKLRVFQIMIDPVQRHTHVDGARISKYYTSTEVYEVGAKDLVRLGEEISSIATAVTNKVDFRWISPTVLKQIRTNGTPVVDSSPAVRPILRTPRTSKKKPR